MSCPEHDGLRREGCSRWQVRLTRTEIECWPWNLLLHFSLTSIFRDPKSTGICWRMEGSRRSIQLKEVREVWESSIQNDIERDSSNLLILILDPTRNGKPVGVTVSQQVQAWWDPTLMIKLNEQHSWWLSELCPEGFVECQQVKRAATLIDLVIYKTVIVNSPEETGQVSLYYCSLVSEVLPGATYLSQFTVCNLTNPLNWSFMDSFLSKITPTSRAESENWISLQMSNFQRQRKRKGW